MYRYAIEIFYSVEDEGYIAVVPELPGCSAFGDDEKTALEEVMNVIELWLATAKKEGRKIPKPKNRGFLYEPHKNNLSKNESGLLVKEKRRNAYRKI